MSRSDPMPPNGGSLTVTFEEDPTGIVEVPDPLVIDATVEEFSVSLKGINAGRLVFVLMGL